MNVRNIKRSLIGMMACIAAVFTACEPIENRDAIGGAMTAEELNISATPVVKDGVNSNYIEVNSEGNPCLSSWDYGFGTLLEAKGIVKVMTTGPNDIIFTGLNPDGSKITKTVTVQVDKLFDVDPEWGMLCGSGEKEWIWDDTQPAAPDGTPAVWGNGGVGGDTAPAWWKVGLGEMEGQAPGEGQGASLVFSIKGSKLVKHKTDGTMISGTFTFDMTKQTVFDGNVWAIGKLTTKNVTVLAGKIINTDVTECLEYDILKLTDKELVLAAPQPGAGQWGEGTFWMFRAK